MQRVLIAEDDRISRRLLESALTREGYEVVLAEDGDRAWEILQQGDPPRLAVLDWMMPGIEGIEICRRMRGIRSGKYVYIILLTAKGGREDIVAGLDAGADDYLIKPYDTQELRSRVRVGERILDLQSSLETKVRELQDAMAHVRQLQGLLPICMHCKKIREKDSWHQLESYISSHSGAMFSHSLCIECMARHYPEYTTPRGETP